jgi:hypothetical protein
MLTTSTTQDTLRLKNSESPAAIGVIRMFSSPPKINFELNMDDPYFDELEKRIRPAVKEFLNHALGRCPQTLGVRACRRGFTEKDAKPTIIISCEKPSIVRKALKGFKGVDTKEIGIKIEQNKIFRVNSDENLNSEVSMATTTSVISNLNDQQFLTYIRV